MVETGTIILIVLYLIVALILWKIFKTVVKVILFLSLITVIILGIASYAVVKDAQTFRDGADKGLVVLYDIDDSIRYGFSSVQNKATLYTDEELVTIQEQITNEEYDTVLGEHLKLFIITRDTIERIENMALDSVQENVPDLSHDEVKQALLQDPQTLVTTHPELEIFPEDDLELYVISQTFSLHIISDPVLLISSYKADELHVYPQTAMFKVFDYLPLGIVKATTVRLIDKGKETGQVAVERIA